MKKTILSTLGAAALLCLCQGKTQAQMFTISEVYGGGGNSGATYTNDFIELYNGTTASIDLSALSVFYASATGAFSATASTPLGNFTLAPGSYFLIQEAQGAGGTTPLPTPNATGTLALSGTAGKVALGLTSTVPTGPTGTGVVDFVGFGTANQFEGTAAAPAPSNTLSISRISPGVDTNQNSLDFATGAPSPTAAAAVPEPSTYAMMGLGALGMFAVLRLRRRTA